MSNEVVVQMKCSTCCTTCLLEDYILTLRSFLASGTKLNLHSSFPNSKSAGCVVVYYPLIPFNTCHFSLKEGMQRLLALQMTKPPILGRLTWQNNTQLVTNP